MNSTHQRANLNMEAIFEALTKPRWASDQHERAQGNKDGYSLPSWLTPSDTPHPVKARTQELRELHRSHLRTKETEEHTTRRYRRAVTQAWTSAARRASRLRQSKLRAGVKS